MGNLSVKERLQKLRVEMARRQIDAALVLSTDEYLNEYVPLKDSLRYYISGFSGSVGDVVVTQSEAYLFVDGRYALQAKKESPDFNITVVSLGVSIEQAWMSALEKMHLPAKAKIAVEGDRISLNLYEKLKKRCQQLDFQLHIETPSLVKQIQGEQVSDVNSHVFEVPQTITGSSLSKRLENISSFFEQNQLDCFLVVALDEIAWLVDLRGNDFPYQATFGARALVYPHEVWLIVQDHRQDDFPLQSGVKIITQSELAIKLKNKFGDKPWRVGIDENSTPVALSHLMQKLGGDISPVKNPLTPMRAHKNTSELRHMRSAFARADAVVHQTASWVCHQVMSGGQVSEYDVKNRVEQEFTNSGAIGLSFKPICGVNENGAIIHYGSPSQEKYLREGDLFLLDTGGYYEGGYATDLTRTFLVGSERTKANPRYMDIFTTVLRGAIAGMSARFPKGTTGAQLDAIVRALIWQAGYNYAHGTGHGVGINVHEFPPRISPAYHGALEVGQVFSIEPGIYIPDFCGVRIENLCTLIDDPQDKDYARVLPLTFSPFDNRLIDKKRLNQHELKFLQYFEACFSLSKEEMPPCFELGD